MTPTVLSSASPTELLHYIVTFQAHPTTIIIGCPEEEFVSSVTADIKSQVTEERLERWEAHLDQDPPHPLLGAPLFREVIARHIRLIFVPTVAHLRANLSVFSPADSSIPPPPNPPLPSNKQKLPLLLIYGFLDLHRDSSEWSAQGIGSSAAVLVEAAQRTQFKPIIVEPKGAGGHQDFKALLREDAPVLSGSLRRDEGGWTGRTVHVKRVLGRWFRFQTGYWDIQWPEEKPQDQH
ncbi:hypothetical protein CkaCkLH20_07735 [Colletotrichum karsti]|uniref:Uncharacterized protein n=1 Tax=Colletotrichum karsti TaxID=1095194 RepID=A0A9P6HZR9_9PEZI|nr:uncharacterized protein CkaCkLH20_07735 [Colletotrichum karsti]KAF9874598.1 hypothetical protein CkaCkLH20_07735 [Colletotrichum karsti]